jgi:hypothetical protein
MIGFEPVSMAGNNKHVLILYYTGTGKYAMNALAGALDAGPQTCDIPMWFPDSFDRLPLPGTPFQNEAAGQIDIETQKHLKKLTAQGNAYGKWKEQIIVAEKLHKLKRN